jgi:hypothetical protein
MMLAAAFLAMLALAFAPAAMAGDHGKKDEHAKTDSQTWTGWITDAACGVKNANSEGKSCALACYKNGSKLVLYVKADDELYEIDQQEKAVQHLGHEVSVTGFMKDGKIKVSKIEEHTAG